MESDKKILIIGASGLIGQAAAQEINSQYAWEGTHWLKPAADCRACDITDFKQVREVFSLVKPSHVIHCANLSGGLDYCQNNPKAANNGIILKADFCVVPIIKLLKVHQ